MTPGELDRSFGGESLGDPLFPTPEASEATRPPHPRLPVFFVDSPVYKMLDGSVPVFHAPELSSLASEIRLHLDAGISALAEILESDAARGETTRRVASAAPELRAVVVAEDDWENAPRENEHPYPPGLPYFTRSTEPPTLVFPEKLSPAIQPRTGATLPLTVWHELAHAFLLRNPVVKTPAWLREFIPQAASAAVAKREGLQLEDHLSGIEHPGFTARAFRSPATAEGQMAFQNLLLSLGNAAVEEFGEGFLNRLVHRLWNETDTVGEERAEELLSDSLGSGGREWLAAREEF